MANYTFSEVYQLIVLRIAQVRGLDPDDLYPNTEISGPPINYVDQDQRDALGVEINSLFGDCIDPLSMGAIEEGESIIDLADDIYVNYLHDECRNDERELRKIGRFIKSEGRHPNA